MFAVFLATWGADLLPVAAVVQNMVAGGSKFILLAIPFFLAAGYLMNSGGITSRLIDMADGLVGHLRGGLAQVNVFHSALLGGISGSSAADAASTTKMMVPEMIKRGYTPAFACAVTASGSILPNIIPPSVAFLVYASVADASVAQLFIGGIGPGILLTIFLMATVQAMAKRRGFEPARRRAPLSRMLRTTVNALPSLGLAVVILVGLRAGIVTATESAAVAVVWAFILGKWLYREYTWRTFYQDMADSAVDSALVGLLIAVSVPFAWVLIAEQVPQQFVTWTKDVVQSPVLILLVINLLLLVLGCFLELAAAILIVVPLFLPLIKAAGIDPIHFGVIVVVNLMIGTLTPPFGILVFICASIQRIPASAIFRETTPFLLASLAALALITAIPEISIGLWRVLEGQ
jgi:tripartite ATP-independent transporter DctM subunit